MKTSLAVVALTLVLVSAVWAAQSNSGAVDHSGCTSKEDVVWHMDRSKSGIPRGCTDSVLKHKLEQLNSQ